MAKYIGIIALDLSGGNFHAYYMTDADPDDRAWEKFVLRCTNLMKASPKGHADLVAAAIRYCTTGAKVPERAEYRTEVQAFMGENFDVGELGMWRALPDAQTFNRATIHGEIVKTFVFVWKDYEEA